MGREGDLAAAPAATRLVEVIDRLPLAVGSFDRSGRFMSRNGALRDLLREVIPSLDPSEAERWQFVDADGEPLDRPDWPDMRALRGEATVPGRIALYATDATEQRWLSLAAVPLAGDQEVAGGILLLQDVHHEMRTIETLREELELRLAGAFLGVMRGVWGRDVDRKLRGLLARGNRDPRGRKNAEAPGALTEREIEVLKLIAWGKSHKAIAAQLGISVKTVQFHRSGAMEKLGLRNRTEIVQFAVIQDWYNSAHD